jgi:hypothetical protein
MEPDGFSSVCLKEYLDICPKPALVLVSTSQPSLEDSFNVCYANRAFLDVIYKDEKLPAIRGFDQKASDNLSSILQSNCVHPTAYQFVEWINTVLKNPNVPHNLLTTFQENKRTTQGTDVSLRTFIEIEWDAVVLQNTFILLTCTRIPSNTDGEKAITNTARRPPMQSSAALMPLPIPATSEVSNNGAHTTKAMSPGSSRRNSVSELGRRTEPFTTTYFTEPSRDSAVSSPKGVDPWRHHEKVNFSTISLIVDFKTYRWRRNHGGHVT